MIKKLEYKDKWLLPFDQKVFRNQFEMAEKINEIIDHLEEREKDVELVDDEYGYVCKEEWEVIKKCLRYCRHRLKQSKNGIHCALSLKDREIFRNIIENL